MVSQSPLSHISVVLVRPRQPENVGFVARAIANFGLGPLVLVNPQTFDPERARWAAPGAREVINQARIVGTVSEAVAGVTQVFGTTARERRLEQACWGPEFLARSLIEEPRPSAILFGPEDSGLQNEEIACCRALISIPTTTETRSLNLAQAVTSLCTILRQESLTSEPEDHPPVPFPNMVLQELLIDEAMEILTWSGYLSGRPRNRVRTTLFQLWNRVQKDGSEAGLIRGMLKGLKHQAGLFNRPE